MSSDRSPDPQEILRRTSRTFALSLAALPGVMREPVEVAYLLARAADTIADTGPVAVEKRIEGLRALRAAVAGAGSGPPDFAGVGPGSGRDDPVAAAEAALLDGIRPLLTRLEALDPADLGEVRRVVARLLRTMEGELAWFLPGQSAGVTAWPDAPALEAYTDGIAGCVGPFWMRLVRRHVHAFSPGSFACWRSRPGAMGEVCNWSTFCATCPVICGGECAFFPWTSWQR
ncbi:MAG: squalene/phytoene synthase family protein [Acidobacteriota bacterium]|nr:squalene/phytoene synthase family protein [Acidobacteriota bacterium]